MHLIMKYFLFTESSYSKGWIRLSFKMLVFYKNTETNDSDYTCFSFFFSFEQVITLEYFFGFAVNLKRSVALHFALIFPLRWSFSWPFDKSPLLKPDRVGQLHKPEGCFMLVGLLFCPQELLSFSWSHLCFKVLIFQLSDDLNILEATRRDCL